MVIYDKILNGLILENVRRHSEFINNPPVIPVYSPGGQITGSAAGSLQKYPMGHGEHVGTRTALYQPENT